MCEGVGLARERERMKGEREREGDEFAWWFRVRENVLEEKRRGGRTRNMD